MSAFDTQTETLFLTSQRLSTTNLILQNRTVQLIHREHYRGGAKTVTLCLSRYNKILGSRAAMTKILFSTREDNVRTLKPRCECSTLIMQSEKTLHRFPKFYSEVQTSSTIYHVFETSWSHIPELSSQSSQCIRPFFRCPTIYEIQQPSSAIANQSKGPIDRRPIGR